MSLRTCDRVLHDPLDRLIGRAVDSDGNGTIDEQTAFVHEGDQIALQFDKTGTGNLAASDLSHRYLWGPAVDMLLADEQVDDLFDATDNETLWALTDNLGSVKDVVDSSGTLRFHRLFDSFGNTVGESYYDQSGTLIADPTTNPEAVTTIFAYTGKLLEVHTGLQYNNARWLDLRTGSWISKDFVWDGTNRYAYVGNSPTNYVDPSGLKKDGHHLVPWALFASEASDEVIAFFDSDEARIFNEWYTSHNRSTVNGVTHPAYSKAVQCELDDFLGGRGVSSMTPKEARAFFTRIKNSTNETIVNFNKGVQAEAYAALVDGDAAYKERKAKGYSDERARLHAKKEAKKTVKSTRELINKKGVPTSMWKKASKWVPLVGTAAVAFSCDDVNAGGRAAFMDLTGLDIPVDGGRLIVAGIEEAIRQGDEFKERVRESEKWGWVSRGKAR